MDKDTTAKLGKVIETGMQEQLGELVLDSTGEALNALLEVETDQICKMLPVTSVRRRGGTSEPVTANASCTPKLVRWSWRCPNCGTRPSRRQSSSATGAMKSQ